MMNIYYNIAFDGSLNAHLNARNNYYQLVGGDFNIDYKQRATGNEAKLLEIFESKLNLLQLISTPTRVSAKKASIIDLIYTSNNNIITDSGVIHCNFSDHDFVYTILKKQSIKKERTSFQFRDVKNLNLASLNHFLDSYDWTKLYECTDSEICWDLLYTAYILAIDEYAPLITMSNVPKREEWMNNDALIAIRKRDKLREQLKCCPGSITNVNMNMSSDSKSRLYSDPDPYSSSRLKSIAAEESKFNITKIKLKQDFKIARNRARQLVNKARYEHIQDKINSAKSTPRKFWQELSTLMPGKKNKGGNDSNKSVITLTDDNGDLLDNPIDSANRFNQFFTNIGPELSSKIDSDNSKYLEEINTTLWNENSIDVFDPVTEKELKNLIKKIDTSKASNVPNINNKL